MSVITSTGNALVRSVAQLNKSRSERERRGAFVVEGIRAVREIPPGRFLQLFMTESFLLRCESAEPEFLDFLDGLSCEKRRVSQEVLHRLSDTQHPQGIIAVASIVNASEDELFPEGRQALILVTERVQDPGNLGTMIRAGEGAGVTGLILAGDTADPYNPKVIRGTMGSVFRVPFIEAKDAGSAADILKKRGVTICAADARAELDYDECDLTGPVAVLIGNEGSGLSEEALSLSDKRFKIPMEGRLESLNAAVCASVMMYEAARQRRRRGSKQP